MDKTENAKRSSSEGVPTPPDVEKHIDDVAPVGILDIPDPDEGLSEGERKAIVHRTVSGSQFSLLMLAGPKTALET